MNTPPHIADLLGKDVTVTGPNSTWTGKLAAYAPDPSVIIDGPQGRVCLPASYAITAAPERAQCPACHGSGTLTPTDAQGLIVSFNGDPDKIREHFDRPGVREAWAATFSQ